MCAQPSPVARQSSYVEDMGPIHSQAGTPLAGSHQALEQIQDVMVGVEEQLLVAVEETDDHCEQVSEVLLALVPP